MTTETNEITTETNEIQTEAPVAFTENVETPDVSSTTDASSVNAVSAKAIKETIVGMPQQIKKLPLKIKTAAITIVSLVLIVCIICATVSVSINASIRSNAQKAYNYINEAYGLVNEFSQDIYEAWFKGINETSSVKGSSYDRISGLEYLVEDMNITLDEIKQGVIHSYYGDEDVPEYYSDYDVEEAYEDILSWYNDEVFSAVVNIVVKTYEVTGRTAGIERLLSEAKTSMKRLGEKYADYAHYPDLKNFLVNTRSMFDFCCNPEGSFEQVVQTFNDYRNEARECYFALDYIFED